MGMPLFAVDMPALMSLLGHSIYGAILGLVAVRILGLVAVRVFTGRA